MPPHALERDLACALAWRGALNCDLGLGYAAGDNCETDTTSDQDDTTAYVIGAVLTVLVVATLVVALLLKW